METIDSVYANDSRVVFHDDGSAEIPDDDGHFWMAEPIEDGGFTMRHTGDQGYVTDEGDRYNQRPKWFVTVDEAICYVIGDPE